MADYSLFAELGLNTKAFEKGLKRAQSSLNGFSSGIKAVAKTLGSLFAIGSIAQFTKEIGKMASSFNDARAEIVKGTGATGQALEQLSQSVTDALQNGVGLSAQEIGGMVADLNTRFGVMGDELTDLVDKFDMFSSVTGTDTRTAINSVADVMSKWGVETEQAGILLDQLTVASQESGASVEELEAGLKSGQAIFSQFGMSVTQSTAFLATLKKNGIDTSQALTGMRTALAKFASEGRNAKTAFRETSESIKNARTETEALQIATEIFGTRSGAEMVRVLRSGSISADEMASKLMNASGALKETDEASRTVKDALDDLKARFTALFSAFSGDNTLRDTIDRIGEAVGNINLEEVETNIRSFITTLVDLANNIGTIIKTIYDNFKELFNTISEMLGNEEGRFEVWMDNIYSVLDSLYRTIQDVFGLIKAILQGDWEVAWQYAKLAVMRAVSVILDNISTVANMFPNLINTMIKGLNKLIDGINIVREFFGQGLIENLGEFTSVDLVEKTGLGKAIEEVEDKIEELTGKTADVQIKALDFVATKRKEFVEETKEGEIDIQGAVAETAEDITETEKEEAEKRKKIFKAMLATMASNIKEWGKKAVETFKKIVSTIGKVFSGIGNIFKNLFSFNIDDALNTMLAFEDSVLTFFVGTLPKLPTFFETAIGSVLMLIQTLIKSIDWDGIKNIIDSIIETFVTYAPQIVSGIVELFTSLVTSISDVLVNNASNIVSAVGEMFFAVIEAIPSLISNFLTVAGTYISQIGNYFASNAEKLSDDLTALIQSIVDGISDFISGDGWKKLLDGLVAILNAIQNAILDNLDSVVDVIIEALPSIIQTLIDFIVSASKAMEKILKPLIKLTLALFEAVIDVLLSDEVLDALLEAILSIIDVIFEELIPKFAYMIPKLIVKIIGFVVKNLPKIVASMIKGLVNAFVKTNWIQVVKDIFVGFIDGIKEFFGIHSPSTLFESFGEFMIEGLWNGIANLGQWLWNNVIGFFSNLWGGITGVFSNVGDWFSNVFRGAKDNISNAFDGIGNWASDRWNDIKNGFSNVGNWFSSTFSTAWTNAKNGFSRVSEWASGVWANIQNGFSGIGNWFSSTFSTAWSNITSVWGNAGNWFKGIADGIKNNFSSCVSNMQSAFSQAGNWVKDMAGKIGSGLSKAGEAIKDGASWVGNKIKNFFGFANGTPSAPHGLALVGEAGPELVRFNGGEQVLNTRNTQKALEGMGGSSNTFNVNFTNVRDTSAYALVSQLKQYNRQMAINGVL